MPASSFEVHRLGEVASTNDELLSRARNGAPDRTVLTARFQSRGRGRLDRRWEAPQDSALLCSVLLRAHLAPEERHLATVAVGLAGLLGCRALGLVGSPASGLKWPNDLVVLDRKLGGILAETDGAEDRDGRVALVIGMGVNLTYEGPPGSHGTSLLAQTDRAVSADELLDVVLEALGPRVDALGTEEGRDRLVHEYLDELVTVGRAVRAQLSDYDYEGVARGVTDRGQLVIETTEGLRVLTAGDVVHLHSADDDAP